MNFFIVNMTADILEPIAVYDTYNEANYHVDRFADIYPQGWIEVMSEDEFNIAAGK